MLFLSRLFRFRRRLLGQVGAVPEVPHHDQRQAVRSPAIAHRQGFGPGVEIGIMMARLMQWINQLQLLTAVPWTDPSRTPGCGRGSFPQPDLGVAGQHRHKAEPALAEPLDVFLRGIPADYLKKALALDPNIAWAHYWLGETLDRLGRRDDALAELEEALRLDPQHEAAQKLRDDIQQRPCDPLP